MRHGRAQCIAPNESTFGGIRCAIPPYATRLYRQTTSLDHVIADEIEIIEDVGSAL